MRRESPRDQCRAERERETEGRGSEERAPLTGRPYLQQACRARTCHGPGRRGPARPAACGRRGARCPTATQAGSSWRSSACVPACQPAPSRSQSPIYRPRYDALNRRPSPRCRIGLSRVIRRRLLRGLPARARTSQRRRAHRPVVSGASRRAADERSVGRRRSSGGGRRKVSLSRRADRVTAAMPVDGHGASSNADDASSLDDEVR